LAHPVRHTQLKAVAIRKSALAHGTLLMNAPLPPCEGCKRYKGEYRRCRNEQCRIDAQLQNLTRATISDPTCERDEGEQRSPDSGQTESSIAVAAL